MMTNDGVELNVFHKPEAEHEFVVISRVTEDGTTLTHLEPEEALALADALQQVAVIAYEAKHDPN